MTTTTTTSSTTTPRPHLQKLPTFKEPAPPPPPSPLEALAGDPIFSAFLSPSFDSAAFSSAALSSGSAASRAESLQDSIRLLHRHLRDEVLLRHDSLLLSLSHLSSLSSSLSSLRSSLSSLSLSVRRARSDLSDPRRLLSLHTSQLHNLHSAAHLLANVSKLLKLSSKLRNNIGTLDIAKAAEMHREIHLLYEEHDLSGISVVEDEIRWLDQSGSRLRSDAMASVERGMDSSNQNDVWCGLQVFYNLGELASTVDVLINKYKSAGVKTVGSALDMKAISASSSPSSFGPGGVQRSGTPQIGGGKRAGDALWERMAKCMEELHRIVMAVWQLQTVLSKKRVPFTQVLFLHEVWQEGDPLPTDRVWEAIVKAFAGQMKSAFTASSFVKEAFTHGYPKLFSMVENLIERIERDTEVKGVLPAIGPEGKEQMVAAINVFQTAFLALCLARLSDYVNGVFPMSSRGSIPSKDQISRLVLRFQEEIEAVKFHGHLMLLVLREIGKVLMLLAERAEYQISTGPESRQVTGPALPAQLKNFALCQHLQEVHTRLSTTVASLPNVAADVLSPSLGVIYGVACDSVTSLFQSMLDRLESCILQIHEQDFGGNGMDMTMDNSASSYMDELQKATVLFRNEFLSKLLPSSSRSETICTQLVRRMASRVLIFFIRHAALVRPLSESGKLRMARDMAELELAVQNLFPVEQLGAPYRALRAFRPVIFLETSQLAGSPVLQDLPPSVVLHHLYSRGPDELQSPMQRNRLTPLQYSLWLDSQGEDQVWKGIKATLDDYELKVRARGDKEFSPVYPIMLQIGSSLAEATSSQ
ncbi:conserved oligomeric Golgi complex subunit 5 [Iris pallida]|uniref:Conserved oligomeric Golgi complex subunit 5 n=1 Tax=Iris pallida TaxID=29817 RepID=A0AAX6FVA4_IRIPA|nr:conserved oligomeric Golgi complex subunit 5 [Iris pallida]